MTIHKPWALQPAIADPDLTYTAQEIRMYMTAVGIVAGQGQLTANAFGVSQRGAGANFSVDVAPGIVRVIGDDIANQGDYYVWNDATANVVTPGAPGSGTRVHRLVLQVRDKVSNGTYTTYDAILNLLQDTGAGTPAEPASAITLALISISVGQGSVTNANISSGPFTWGPISDAAPGSNTAGFTASSAIVRKLGKAIFFNLVTVNTGAVTASGSPLDFGSTSIYTLNSTYWPSEPNVFAWTTGSRGGTGIVSAAGVVTLETTNDTILAASTIRCGGIAYVQA